MKKVIYSYTYVSSSGSSGAMIKSNVKIPLWGTFEYDGDVYIVIEECGSGFDFIAKRV